MRKEKLLDSNNYYFKDQSPKGRDGRRHVNVEIQLEITLRILKKEQKSWQQKLRLIIMSILCLISVMLYSNIHGTPS